MAGAFVRNGHSQPHNCLPADHNRADVVVLQIQLAEFPVGRFMRGHYHRRGLVEINPRRRAIQDFV